MKLTQYYVDGKEYSREVYEEMAFNEAANEVQHYLENEDVFIYNGTEFYSRSCEVSQYEINLIERMLTWTNPKPVAMRRNGEGELYIDFEDGVHLLYGFSEMFAFIGESDEMGLQDIAKLLGLGKVLKDTCPMCGSTKRNHYTSTTTLLYCPVGDSNIHTSVYVCKDCYTAYAVDRQNNIITNVRSI